METSALNPMAPPFASGQVDVKGRETSLDLDRIRSTVFSDFTSLVNGDTDGTAISNLADMYTYLYSTIQALESKAEIVDPAQTYATVQRLEREVDFLNYENYQLKLQLSSIEDTARFMNLRVEGMTEHNNNNLISQVAKVLSKTGVQCHPSDLDYARRIGKFRSGHIRPVLVRFMKESKRNAILYGRNNVNKKRSPNNNSPLIWINDDVSDMTRRNRKSVRDIATLAKLQGDGSVRVHGDGLVVGDGKYRHRDLDLLPSELTLSKAKTREEEEDIFFQGEFSPLSNFFPTHIVAEDSIEFCSAEQAFQFRRACFVGEEFISTKILRTRDPYEIKRLSNFLPPNEEWKAIQHKTMADILRLKFTQNVELRQFLLDTGNKSLHEATNSEYWAIGAELSSKALETRTWEGLDMLGSILMELRQSLVSDDDNISPPSVTSTNNDRTDNDMNLKPMSDDEGSVHGDDLANTPVLPDPPALADPPPPMPKTAPSVTDKAEPIQPSNQSADQPKQTKQSISALPRTATVAKQSTPDQKSTTSPSQGTPSEPAHSTPKHKSQSVGQQHRTTADYFSPKPVCTGTSSQTEDDSPPKPSPAVSLSQRPTRTCQRAGKRN